MAKDQRNGGAPTGKCSVATRQSNQPRARARVPSVAAEIDRQDLHDRMLIAFGALLRGVAVLVVDSAGAGDLVVNRLRISGPLRTVVLALHHAARADLRRRARSVGDVIPELVRVLAADPVYE